MEAKKSPKADLEGKKVIFTQIGLIIALAATLLAFEWKSYDKSYNFDLFPGLYYCYVRHVLCHRPGVVAGHGCV